MKKAVLVGIVASALACGGGENSWGDLAGGSGKGGGGGDGDGTGDGDGDGDGTGNGHGTGNPDPDGNGVCEEQMLRTDRVTPDMLIVLDRSGSMKDDDANRWDPSVSGLNAITGQLDDVIRFGLMTFPGSTDRCAPGELDVPVALDNAGQISSELAGMEPEGRTPTAATLRGVLEEFTRTPDDPDRVSAPKYVLLVTDGAPNCMNDGGRGDSRGAVTATVDAVEALAEAGIPTYVLGYDTQDDADLRDALDRMARAGDTGDQAHRAIEDEDSLRQEFEAIAGSAVSCEYALEQTAADPSFVLVKLDGNQLNHGHADGWVLEAEGKRVRLQGQACQTLRGGGQHTLSVSVQCDIVQPL